MGYRMDDSGGWLKNFNLAELDSIANFETMTGKCDSTRGTSVVAD